LPLLKFSVLFDRPCPSKFLSLDLTPVQGVYDCLARATFDLRRFSSRKHPKPPFVKQYLVIDKKYLVKKDRSLLEKNQEIFVLEIIFYLTSYK